MPPMPVLQRCGVHAFAAASIAVLIVLPSTHEARSVASPKIWSRGGGMHNGSCAAFASSALPNSSTDSDRRLARKQRDNALRYPSYGLARPGRFHSAPPSSSSYADVSVVDGTTTDPARSGEGLSAHETTTVHLISLPPLTPTLHPTLRRLWSWKDSALGDGRDYFVPRPRAIRSLASSVIAWGGGTDGPAAGEGGETTTTRVAECAALSNCARLDVLVAVVASSVAGSDALGDDDRTGDSGGAATAPPPPDADDESDETEAGTAARIAVARTLASQLLAQRARSNGSAIWDGVKSFLDLPGVVAVGDGTISFDPRASSILPDVDVEFERLATLIASELVQLGGAERVSRHLALVGAGMASRPSRPGRDVPFRPFSSRDAHVMLQLKRTAEVAIGPRVKVILDSALQAGKAARDPQIVPQIEPLRAYGTSQSSRYSRGEAPHELIFAATEAAKERAIEPVVERCKSRLKAMEAAGAVSRLRKKADDMVLRMGVGIDDSQGRKVRKILHEPCMDLRAGFAVDEEAVLSRIRAEISSGRPSADCTAQGL